MIFSPGRLGFLFFGLLLIIYFGFNITSPDLRVSSKIKSQTLKATGLENIEKGALKSLTPSQKAELDQFNKLKTELKLDQEKVEILKKISGFWFNLNQYSLAGGYAKKVAEIEKTEEAWKIAGSSFLYGLDGSAELKLQQFCQQEAVFCFEQAISLNTAEPSYQLYLAMAYVKLPGAEPMKGIKMMLDLETKFPEYLDLQLQLAELGIQTGQFEKAKLRIEKIIIKEPKNSKANCLMLQILESLGQTKDLNKYQLLCK